VNVFPRTVGLMLLGAGIWKSGLLTGKAADVGGEVAGVGGEVVGVGGAAGVSSNAAGDLRGIALFGAMATAVGFGLAALDRPAILRGMVAPIVLALGYGALIFVLASRYSPASRFSPANRYSPDRQGAHQGAHRG